MALPPNLHELGAIAAVEGVARGDFTVEALTGALLDHIEDREPEVLAWAHLDRAATLARAAQVDRAGAAPLKGLLFGVKDVIDTSQMPTCYGSRAYAGNQPAWDSSVVAMSRLAGAMVLGKTVTTEFAGMSPGPTRNPHNPAHTPGGSSSGSAAAVAAGMVPIALGTQTAGSTIRPASYCGVVSYKPSFDVIDPTGVKTLARCLDTVGLFGRSVADVAYYVAKTTERDALVLPETVAAPRIGLFRTEAWDKAGPGTVAAMDRAVAALGAKGVAIGEIAAPADYLSLLPLHDALIGWGIVTGLRWEHCFRRDLLSPVTIGMFDQRREASSSEAFDEAFHRARALRHDVNALFGECDVLLVPAAPDEAPLGLGSTGDASFNSLWTVLHAPCVTVPAIKGANGLPVGVQVVGRQGDDARVLAAARFVEAALADG